MSIDRVKLDALRKELQKTVAEIKAQLVPVQIKAAETETELILARSGRSMVMIKNIEMK